MGYELEDDKKPLTKGDIKSLVDEISQIKNLLGDYNKIFILIQLWFAKLDYYINV